MIENFCLSRKPNLILGFSHQNVPWIYCVLFLHINIKLPRTVSSVVDPMVYRHCSGYHTRLVMGRRGFKSCSGHVVFFFHSRDMSFSTSVIEYCFYFHICSAHNITYTSYSTLNKLDAYSDNPCNNRTCVMDSYCPQLTVGPVCKSGEL